MKKWLILLMIIIALPILGYLLLSLITGSFCPPNGWQGPFPPWCTKHSSLGPFIYSDLPYLDNSALQPKTNKILLGIGMNDLWGNPHVAIDMGEDSRKLVAPSMKRLSTIGSKILLITDFAIYNKEFKVLDATPANAAGAYEISSKELLDIVYTAKQNNQNKVFLTVNLYDSEYIYKKWLNQDLTETAYEKLKTTDKKVILETMFPEWKNKILKIAKKAEDSGVDYLIINPTDMNFEYFFDLDGLNERYEGLIPEIRKVFKGKIGFYSTIPRYLSSKRSSFDKIDFIIVASDVNADYIEKELFKNTGKDSSKVKEAFKSWLANPNWKNIPETKEIYINLLVPSYSGAIQNGWIEPRQGENSWKKDWEEQAIAYDSFFRAIYEGDYKIAGIFSYGYWWSDQIYPVAKDLRNDLTQSIRQKDAEKVFYRWSNILNS